MTSSLVGSEMCIRDSSLSGSAPAVPWKCAQQSRVRELIMMIHEGASVSLCLLYTSDAADDM
eukprot:11091614-Prorocentrum_lima.AAC.1